MIAEGAAWMASKVRVISANRLADGTVVYFGKQGRWVESFGEAKAYADESAFQAALARAQADDRANLVLDVVAVDALKSGADLRPSHIREAIRAAGPTVRRDHGKQAQEGRVHPPVAR
jgi:hypothetical protein